MKTLITLIYLGLPFIALGQLKGEFNAGNGPFVETIIFKKDKTFHFELSGSAGVLYFGAGNYTLQDSNLTLHFINPYDTIEPVLNIYSEPSNGDSISIRYKMRYRKNKEDYYLSGILLEVLDEKNLEERIALGLVGLTDLNGIGVLKLPVSDTITSLRISALGCINIDFDFVLNQDYDIYSECTDEYRYIETGITFDYIIKERTRRELLMSSENTNGFITYRKKRSFIGLAFLRLRFYIKRKRAEKKKQCSN